MQFYKVLLQMEALKNINAVTFRLHFTPKDRDRKKHRLCYVTPACTEVSEGRLNVTINVILSLPLLKLLQTGAMRSGATNGVEVFSHFSKPLGNRIGSNLSINYYHGLMNALI